MKPFLEQLADGFHTKNAQNSRCLLAVSGGADSMALLCGMLELRSHNRQSLSVVHVNHGLRGAISDRDCAWLVEYCRQSQVECLVKTVDVAAESAIRNSGLEETARDLRYEFFIEAARQQACELVAVAHTADDQAETILHHILRGTGIAGLRGIPACRPLADGLSLIRPLLSVTRHEIEEYLSSLGQTYRQDATNADSQYTRNRIRNDLLPMLEQEFNPQVRLALTRLGAQAREIEETLNQLARPILQQAMVDRSSAMVRLDGNVLCQQPRHLLRVCFTLLWTDLEWPRQRMGFAEWDSLAELVHQGGATRTLPGNIEACRRESLLVLRRKVS